MKLCLAQINTVVGDLEGNSMRILEAWDKATAAGADLVLFPELSLTGYPPMDLLERGAFIDASLDAWHRLVVESGPDRCPAVLGIVDRNASGPGKPLVNAAAVVVAGQVVAFHRKALLPTYDVFDESRYFEPFSDATVVDLPFGRVGITICEDIWNDPSLPGRPAYREEPVARVAALRADLLVNISASPFEVGKSRTRLQLARNIALRHGFPVAYCNLIGGNDGLVFDGGSFVVRSDGTLAAMGPFFREELVAVSLAEPSLPLIPDPDPEPVAEIVDALCLGLRDFCGKLGFQQVVLGLSGGIDSAVVSALAVRALGPGAVTAIGMPSRFSSDGTRSDAALLASNLRICFTEIPIDGVFESYVGALSIAMGERPGGVTEENLQARIRGALLMAWSNRRGALVLNTGNKSELAVGYSTLYGDMVGGLAVIGDLTKDLVYAVARYLNRDFPCIPESTMDRAPSAELRPDQKDEDSLPPYPLLDEIVRAFVEDGVDGQELLRRGFPAETVAWVLGAISASEYKRRQAPLALKVTRKAFGVGRRFPIVQRFREGLT
jgi:NAD+ synthetase